MLNLQTINYVHSSYVFLSSESSLALKSFATPCVACIVQFYDSRRKNRLQFEALKY